MYRRIEGVNIEFGSASFVKEQGTGGHEVNNGKNSADEMVRASKVKEKVVGIRELKKMWKID